MLYAPILPEVAAGAIEARHVTIPLRMMCPHAEVLLGRATALDEDTNVVTVDTGTGTLEVGYENLVVALGAVASWLPIPGLAQNAIGSKNLADAIHLRDHVVRQLDTAGADLDDARRHLTFVFVGAGYAGVEALAEVRDLVADALRHRPELRDVPQRWVLVDLAPVILPEAPSSLGEYAAEQLRRRGAELRLSTTVTTVDGHAVELSDGTRIETSTIVWTAGVKPNDSLAALGLPLDPRGRVIVDPALRVEGRTNVWGLGDCAAVPNQATPDRVDPPTCQHALRHARHLAKNLQGTPTAVPVSLARARRDAGPGQGCREPPREVELQGHARVDRHPLVPRQPSWASSAGPNDFSHFTSPSVCGTPTSEKSWATPEPTQPCSRAC